MAVRVFRAHDQWSLSLTRQASVYIVTYESETNEMKIAMGVLVLVVLLVGLVFSMPFLIDLNTYQDQYKPIIEEALNRKVQLQDIRLTIWPRIGARVAGFSVLDDPVFGSGEFASLSSLDVGVKLGPLLNGTVEVEEITLHEPVITVIKNKKGVLNASTIGRKGLAISETPSRAPIPSTEGPLKILAMLAVDRVSITGGKLTYRDLSAAKPTEYVLQDIDLLLTSVRLGQTPSLHLDTVVQPLNLPVKLDGTFGPLKDTTDIEAINFQLGLGKTDFTVTGKAAGHNATVNISSAVINTANLPVSLPLKEPIDITNLNIAADVHGQEARLNALSLQVFDGQVKGQGKLIAGSDAPPFNGTLSIQGVQLSSVMKAVTETALSISGTAGTDFVLKGRGFSMPDLSKALEGTGHVAVKDGKIEGVNLLREALTILRIAGVVSDDPNATVFSTVEADLAVNEGIVQVQRLLMDSHDFQATGGGTLDFDQKLNLTIKIHLSQDLSQKIAGLSPVAKLAVKEGRLVLPLTIGGTIQTPSYGLDMKGVGANVQEQVKQKVEKTVNGLLRGTTTPQDLQQQGQELLKGLLGR